ncbi:hypothetical protein [Streptomyces luteireticuli]|uniref:hypothetical protein n=1 Tax=Streptomyces luteireticuli TaxID=173858 RepID=UPI0035587BD2
MSIWRETRDDDDRRTGALLDALDAYGEARDPHHLEPLSDFEEVVLFGVAGDPAQPYPPAGHKYPRRG